MTEPENEAWVFSGKMSSQHQGQINFHFLKCIKGSEEWHMLVDFPFQLYIFYIVFCLQILTFSFFLKSDVLFFSELFKALLNTFSPLRNRTWEAGFQTLLDGDLWGEVLCWGWSGGWQTRREVETQVHACIDYSTQFTLFLIHMLCLIFIVGLFFPFKSLPSPSSGLQRISSACCLRWRKGPWVFRFWAISHNH